MSVIATLLAYVLTAFVLLLIARMVLDWAGVLANGPRWARRARALNHAATETVIAPPRQLPRPVSAGPLHLDLALTAVFVVVLILRSIDFSL